MREEKSWAAVRLTTMTDSLHLHNSNPRNHVKGFASRHGESVLRRTRGRRDTYLGVANHDAIQRLHPGKNNQRVEFGGAAGRPRKRLRLTRLSEYKEV